MDVPKCCNIWRMRNLHCQLLNLPSHTIGLSAPLPFKCCYETLCIIYAPRPQCVRIPKLVLARISYGFSLCEGIQEEHWARLGGWAKCCPVISSVVNRPNIKFISCLKLKLLKGFKSNYFWAFELCFGCQWNPRTKIKQFKLISQVIGLKVEAIYEVNLVEERIQILLWCNIYVSI